jgi:hypothetical protein
VALSREVWIDLLARAIQAPQTEPPVRRRSRRYNVCLGGAWRLVYQKAGRLVELGVRLLNASADGVMLLCRSEVPVRIPAVVAFTSAAEGEYMLTGEVRHCTSTVGGHKVGVQLHFAPATEGCRASSCETPVATSLAATKPSSPPPQAARDAAPPTRKSRAKPVC